MCWGKGEAKKNNIFIYITIVALLFIPMAAFGQDEAQKGDAPPIAQPLIREGEFAVQLVEELRLGTTDNEAEAEGILVSAEIEPRNGWISDYPVTPDIIDEVEKAVAVAADSGQLAMGRDEAVQAVEDLAAKLGLPVLGGADNVGLYAENNPSENYGEEYPNSSEISTYYSNAGPPVVTYYTPPQQYFPLYSWVPYPFWCNRVFFSGFFILHDFHRTIFVHKKRFVVTNHSVDPRTKAVSIIDPLRGIRNTIVSAPKHNVKSTVQGHGILPQKGAASPESQRGVVIITRPRAGGTSVPGDSVPPAMNRGFSRGFGGSSSGGGAVPRGGCVGRC